AALEPGEDHPARLVDPASVPLALPVPDRADALSRRGLDDPEHLLLPLARRSEVPLVPLRDLPRALRAAEVLGHRGIAQQLLEQQQVSVGPRLDAVLGLAQSISFRSIAWIAIRHMIRAKTTSTPTRSRSFHSKPYSTAARTSSTHWCSGFSSPRTCAH